MKTFGPYVAARTLRQDRVTLLRGVDRLTGMPVLIFELPRPVPLPDLTGPNLLAYADSGEQDGVMFATAVLPPAAAHPSDPRAVAEGALTALEWLHGRGIVHGGIAPETLWSIGGEVCLAGAGLPWLDGLPGEREASPAADLLALGRVLQQLGPLPPALLPLLDEDADRRPTAAQALARLRAEVAERGPAEGAGDAPPQQDADHRRGESPAGASVVVVPSRAAAAGAPQPGGQPGTPGELQHRDLPAYPPLLDVAFPDESPPEVPDAAPAADSARRAEPLRIGWEEDHSWRVVKSAYEPPRAARRQPVWLWPGAAVLAMLLALAVWAARGEPAAPCCVVEFQVAGDLTVSGSLQVVRAPAESGLSEGQLLGTVPGAVRFPDAPGLYVLRLRAEGYQEQTMRLDLPVAQPVLIEVGR